MGWGGVGVPDGQGARVRGIVPRGKVATTSARDSRGESRRRASLLRRGASVANFPRGTIPRPLLCAPIFPRTSPPPRSENGAELMFGQRKAQEGALGFVRPRIRVGRLHRSHERDKIENLEKIADRRGSDLVVGQYPANPSARSSGTPPSANTNRFDRANTNAAAADRRIPTVPRPSASPHNDNPARPRGPTSRRSLERDHAGRSRARAPVR
jgi:hypothetical protein